MGSCNLTPTSSLAAQIKYLPKREDILNLSPERLPSNLNEKAYGHPVLIISPNVDEIGKVVVFLMTSFGGQNILVKFPNTEPGSKQNRRIRENYWPIKPTPNHPDTSDRLQLKDGRDIDRPYSYIDTQTSYPLPYDILWRYNGPGPEENWVLDDESFKKVAGKRDYVKFHSENWRGEPQETPPPLPEPVRERKEEGKQAAKNRTICDIDLARENQWEIMMENYEEMMDSWPWDDMKRKFGIEQVDDPDP
ncbi:hypothetical protein B0T20DRAFT_343288 [Sordaria brevicollis]|uniref:Uncharacterized protein n=1 Tax=Sordaria brevicollis TaxID=83679 RepID=A0AAE0PMV6_SORBR|nr:hypothetical protein B0T20DRAFT_343288 [Sordaria brevicollis]